MYYALLVQDSSHKLIFHHVDKSIVLQKIREDSKTFVESQGVRDIYNTSENYYIVEEDEIVHIYHNAVQKGYVYNSTNREHIQTYKILSYNTEKDGNPITKSNLIKQKKKLKTPETVDVDVINIFDELRNNTYFQKLRINVEL